MEKFYKRSAIPPHNRMKPNKLSSDDLKLAIENRKWYQSFDFGKGLTVKGTFASGAHVDKVLPDNMNQTYRRVIVILLSRRFDSQCHHKIRKAHHDVIMQKLVKKQLISHEAAGAVIGDLLIKNDA